MEKLTELYNICEKKGIKVYSFALPLSKAVAVMDIDGSCQIGIDPFSLTSEHDELEVLAHELGHCETGSFYNRYSSVDLIEKHETRAHRWAIHCLIPKEELNRQLRCGKTELWDLAEYFCVSEQFMQQAIDLYKEQF